MNLKPNNKRTQKGITLIALVVTIVVLLILAGVSINAIFGQDGIIQKAKDAQNKMDQATQNDLESINELNNWIDGKINENTGGTVEGQEGSLLAMYQKAQKENCDNADGKCNDATHLHIGDYVDYKNPASGTVEVTSAESGIYGKDSNGNEVWEVKPQTYTLSTSKNNVKWRVLGIDSETGGLKIISADPIEKDGKDPYLYLRWAEAYVYGPDTMNKVSEMYLNPTYATRARSVTADDINEVTGITTQEKIEEVHGMKINYGNEYSFEGQLTPELAIQVYREGKRVNNTTIRGISTGYQYYINCPEKDNSTNLTITNKIVRDMLFKDVEIEKGKAYWLASRNVIATAKFACFGPGIVASASEQTIVSTGGFFQLAGTTAFFFRTHVLTPRGIDIMAAIRPVVILKSDVMAEVMPKIADQTSTWTYVAPSNAN